MIKDLMTTDEYNGYIKGQILGHLNNSNWKAIHDLLIKEKLVEVKNEIVIKKFNDETAKEINIEISDKETDPNNELKKFSKIKFRYNKNVTTFKRNTKTYKMLERYIKHVISNHFKNGQFYEDKNKEITLFFIDNEIMIPLDAFKDYFNFNKSNKNWLRTIGSYFTSGDIISYQKAPSNYYPYIAFNFVGNRKVLYNGKFRELREMAKYSKMSVSVINVNPNFVKEIGCYDEIRKLRG